MTSMARRHAAIAAVCVLAFLSAHTAWATERTETLVFTQDFLMSEIGQGMLALPTNVKGALNGTVKKAPSSAPKRLSIQCLNSVAPAPLNWKMWCPNTHANVTQWIDDTGSTHRKIVLNPMKNMTAQMAVWFMTPAFPETLTVNGKEFHKHVLWHPIDHYQPLKFRMVPGKVLLDAPQLQTQLAEKYRALPGQVDRGYRTELWVTANDLALNLPRNRYVLGFDVMGFQAFTLVVEFSDSPQGLVVSVEVILGVAGMGYDKKNPFQGVAKPLAAAANALLFETVMQPFKENGDFDAAMDAVTRHVVEEFSNLQRFVPLAWEQEGPGVVMQRLGDFKASVLAATAKLPLSKITEVVFKA